MEDVNTPEEAKETPKTEEELASEEPEMDLANPDATPHRYNIFAREQNKRVTEMVNEFVEKLEKTDIPFAFAEIAGQILNGKLKVLKARCKNFESLNRLHNKIHLTPINQMEKYETIEESNAPLEDLDGQELV